jgi:hypothetical protein
MVARSNRKDAPPASEAANGADNLSAFLGFKVAVNPLIAKEPRDLPRSQ